MFKKINLIGADGNVYLLISEFFLLLKSDKWYNIEAKLNL